VKHGVRPDIDVTRAEVAVARARAELVDAVNGVEIAHRTLETALGGEPVEGEPALPAEPDLARADRTRLVALARRVHPTLVAAAASLRGVQASLAGAERLAWPDVSASGLYGLRAQDTSVGPGWQAGVNVSVPIFTGFAITRQQEAAREAERAARATYRDRELEVALGVTRAHIALGGARERLVALRAAHASARLNHRQAETRYRNGVGSIIEVSEAQTLLATAQAEVVRGEAGYHLAIAQLTRAVGLTGLEPAADQDLEGPRP
jgi:outer membrane protein TolC